ncbi:MAG: helix-turn-helix transcriptional regulator [Chloroflexota bacterium]
MLETYIPKKPLSDYIEMMWYWKDYHPPHPRERILPSGMMEITISLSDVPFHITDDIETSCIRGAMVAGARSTPFIIDTRQPISILSVWFKPGGAKLFFGVPSDKLVNRHLSLESLWGSYANSLYSRLGEARSSLARFQLLEDALLYRLLNATERHRAVSYAIDIFRTAPQNTKIKDVVDSIALSSTRFIQVFREDVGMTPKQFCRVRRFQQVLKVMAGNKTINWVDLALSCGFYDQSHFINEFRQFAGIKPTAYAPQSYEHNTNLPVFD